MKAPCGRCKYKCNSFWSLGSYERQKDFVCSNVMEKKTKTYLDENNQVNPKRRMVYHTFTFECEGKSHQVCQKFFTATLNIGEGYTTKQVKQNWHM